MTYPRDLEGPQPSNVAALLGEILIGASSVDRADFMRWMVRLRELTPTCSAVRHGRWLPDLRWGNVLMLPPPGEQGAVSRVWEVQQLARAAEGLTALYRDLLRLCAIERGLSLTNAARFLSTQPLDVAEVEADGHGCPR